MKHLMLKLPWVKDCNGTGSSAWGPPDTVCRRTVHGHSCMALGLNTKRSKLQLCAPYSMLCGAYTAPISLQWKTAVCNNHVRVHLSVPTVQGCRLRHQRMILLSVTPQSPFKFPQPSSVCACVCSYATVMPGCFPARRSSLLSKC